jgi:hypothetical protein
VIGQFPASVSVPEITLVPRCQALFRVICGPGGLICLRPASCPASFYTAVVFWDDLLQNLHSADPESAREIEQAAFRWDNQVVDVRGGTQVMFGGGRGYGISRQRFLDIHIRRAQGAGAHIEFDREVTATR